MNAVFDLPPQQAGPPVFQAVCNGCAPVSNSLPKGIDDNSTWLLPVCEDPPTGTRAVSQGTTTQTLTLNKGYYRDTGFVEELLACYRPQACAGGDHVGGYCAVGYEGPCEAVISLVRTFTTVDQILRENEVMP